MVKFDGFRINFTNYKTVIYSIQSIEVLRGSVEIVVNYLGEKSRILVVSQLNRYDGNDRS